MGLYDRDWYWQDRARKERQYYNPREFRSQGAGVATHSGALPRRVSAVSANIAAATAAVVVCLLAGLVAQWRAETVATEMQRASQEAAQRAQAQVEHVRHEAEEQQARRNDELQRQEALRSKAISERQHFENDRKRAVMAETDRKERAWARFYRKSAICDDAATVECANTYIRAKHSFEEKYARGEL